MNVAIVFMQLPGGSFSCERVAVLDQDMRSIVVNQSELAPRSIVIPAHPAVATTGRSRRALERRARHVAVVRVCLFNEDCLSLGQPHNRFVFCKALKPHGREFDTILPGCQRKRRAGVVPCVLFTIFPNESQSTVST